MDGACAHFEKNPSVPLPTTHLEIWEGDKMDERGGRKKENRKEEGVEE